MKINKQLHRNQATDKPDARPNQTLQQSVGLAL
jgi:hypothetical protein